MDVSSNSHAHLVRAARDGRREALEELLSAYRNYLKLLAQTQIRLKVPANLDASDLVQETLWEAYRDFGEFHGTSVSEMTAWLRRILVRNLKDQIRFDRARKRDQQREQSLDDAIQRTDSGVAEVLQTTGSSPSVHAANKEQAILLADALQRLSDEYREVILLRQFERLSFAEVGARMERSAGAAKMLFARAIDRLRQELGEVDQ